MHDEILFRLKKGTEEEITNKLNESIKEVNAEVKLNVPLGISMDYGNSYADCH